jgi:hypothetical protein
VIVFPAELLEPERLLTALPDRHPGDAAGRPDDDQAGAVLGQLVQQQPRRGEHQRRLDQPGHERMLARPDGRRIRVGAGW